MIGTWDVDAVLSDGDPSTSDLKAHYVVHVMEGYEEHFEGDHTGVLKKFKTTGSTNGEFRCEVVYDDTRGPHQFGEPKPGQVARGEHPYLMRGTFKNDQAKAQLI